VIYRGIRIQSSALIAMAALLGAATSGAAQPAPAEDDVEVNAKPAQPSSPPPPPATGPLIPPTPPSTRDETAELKEQLAATQARLDRLEKQSISQLDKVPGEPSLSSRLLPAGVALDGYVQSQYEAHQDSQDQILNGTYLNQDRFLVRRARLRFDAQWQYSELTFELDANTVKGPIVTIRRAEATLVFRNGAYDGKVVRHSPREDAPPLAALTIGVTDIPFGFELLDSPRERVFMERTQGSQALFPSEPDVGVRLWGGAGFFRYQLALFNGEPLSDTASKLPGQDPNAAKDFVARVGVDTTPFKGWRLMAGVSALRGSGFHAGTDATKNGLTWTDTNENGSIDLGEVTPVPGAAATPSVSFDRWGVAGDLELWIPTAIGRSMIYGEATMASNLDRGFYPADPVITGVDIRELAYYGAFVQEVTPYGLAGFRVDVYDPNADLFDGRKGRLIPTDAKVTTFSPVAGLVLPGHARLLFQYDFVRDHLGRDARGVPADLANDRWTLRLQVQP
jgi:hypothetical protein